MKLVRGLWKGLAQGASVWELPIAMFVVKVDAGRRLRLRVLRPGDYYEPEVLSLDQVNFRRVPPPRRRKLTKASSLGSHREEPAALHSHLGRGQGGNPGVILFDTSVIIDARDPHSPWHAWAKEQIASAVADAGAAANTITVSEASVRAVDPEAVPRLLEGFGMICSLSLCPRPCLLQERSAPTLTASKGKASTPHGRSPCLIS